MSDLEKEAYGEASGLDLPTGEGAKPKKPVRQTRGDSKSLRKDLAQALEEGDADALAAYIERSVSERVALQLGQERLHNPRSARASTVQCPKIHPQKYNGQHSWEVYLAQFEGITAAQGLSQGQRATLLFANLEGEALTTVVQTCTDTTNYSVLCDTICRHFSPPRQTGFYLSQMQRRRKSKDETYESLGRDILHLASKAFPGGTVDFWEGMALNAYIDAIEEKELRSKLRDRMPTTVSQAMQWVREIETAGILENMRVGSGDGCKGRRAVVQECSDTESDGEGPETIKHQARFANIKAGKRGDRESVRDEVRSAAASNTMLADLMKQKESLEKLMLEVQDQLAGVKATGTFHNKPSLTCWNCGKVGHMQRNCRGQARGYRAQNEGPQMTQYNSGLPQAAVGEVQPTQMMGGGTQSYPYSQHPTGGAGTSGSGNFLGRH